MQAAVASQAALATATWPQGLALSVRIGGHSVPLDKPAPVANLVLDFLAELDARS